jgi:hypothetical protein
MMIDEWPSYAIHFTIQPMSRGETTPAFTLRPRRTRSGAGTRAPTRGRTRGRKVRMAMTLGLLGLLAVLEIQFSSER